MSTVFDYIDSIIHTKKHVEDIKYDENQYSAYMVNRWISMSDCSAAQIINESTNRYWSVLTDRVDHYDLLLCLMPTQRKKKINYIKKIKDEPAKKADENLKLIARNMEMSTRELKTYMSQ